MYFSRKIKIKTKRIKIKERVTDLTDNGMSKFYVIREAPKYTISFKNSTKKRSEQVSFI